MIWKQELELVNQKGKKKIKRIGTKYTTPMVYNIMLIWSSDWDHSSIFLFPGSSISEET